MLAPLRSFLVVLEEGSLNAAASRLRVSQPTLTRQVQALEQEIGGPLLERSSAGVRPTAAGTLLAERMRGVLQNYDAVIAETRLQASGHTDQLRIGYLLSAAQSYLYPAIALLRKEMPRIRITTLDQSPGEQIEALRQGEIDLAMVGQEGRVLGREFYSRKIATLRVVAALPPDHPLAAKSSVLLKQLSSIPFLSAPEQDVPGRDRWVREICKKAGFRPRFSSKGTSLIDGLYMVVSEEATFLMPEYPVQMAGLPVALVPIRDKHATWDFHVFWQRGRTSQAIKIFVDGLDRVARNPGSSLA